MRVLSVLILVSALTPVFSAELTSLDDLSYDENGHLARNYLLFWGVCADRVSKAWLKRHETSRTALPVSEHVASLFFPNTSCFVVCLSQGTSRASVVHPLPEHRYNPDTSLTKWLSSCQRVEFGVASYLLNTTLRISWIDSANISHDLASVEYGERKSVWQTVYIGHTFEIHSNTLLQRVTVLFPTLLTFGSPPHRLGDIVLTEDIQRSLFREYNRSLNIKRTFTPTGFSKGRLPPHIWTSMNAYYYNNGAQFVTEAWKDGGLFVNWWEAKPSLLLIPPVLSHYWHEELRYLVENWIGGEALESTNIYGIRRYVDGARLLTHVDRHATHAVSLIINVGQGGMREPWHVEIYDFAGRLHEIPMEPGDIVYYESARCLHGRMKPLEGAYYDNLFTHYRPVGDPEWYLKAIPQVKKYAELSSFMVPEFRVAGPDDLFEYWKTLSPRTGERDEL